MRDRYAAMLVLGAVAAMFAAPATASPDTAGGTEVDGDEDASAPAEPTEEERFAAAVRVAETAPRGPARDAAVAELSKAGWRDLVRLVGEGGARADAALDALAATDAARLRECLTEAARPEADLIVRIVALRTVPVTKADVGVADVVAVASAASEDQRRNPVLGELIRSGVAAVLARRPDEIAPLRGTWPGLDETLRAICLDAAERTGTRAVSALLGARPGGDGEVLARLARMPVRSASPYARGTEAAVLDDLRHPDAATRRGATHLAGRIGGIEIARALVVLLDDAETGDAAHAAIQRASGTTLIRDAALWRVRLADQATWSSQVWPGEADVLERGTPDETAAALVRIAPRRLHGEAVRDLIERTATHPDPKVRRAAIDVLGRLGRPASIPVLDGALDDPDRAVAATASAALAAVTGIDAPTDEADWRRILER